MRPVLILFAPFFRPSGIPVTFVAVHCGLCKRRKFARNHATHKPFYPPPVALLRIDRSVFCRCYYKGWHCVGTRSTYSWQHTPQLYMGSSPHAALPWSKGRLFWASSCSGVLKLIFDSFEIAIADNQRVMRARGRCGTTSLYC